MSPQGKGSFRRNDRPRREEASRLERLLRRFGASGHARGYCCKCGRMRTGTHGEARSAWREFIGRAGRMVIHRWGRRLNRVSMVAHNRGERTGLVDLLQMRGDPHHGCSLYAAVAAGFWRAPPVAGWRMGLMVSLPQSHQRNRDLFDARFESNIVPLLRLGVSLHEGSSRAMHQVDNLMGQGNLLLFREACVEVLIRLYEFEEGLIAGVIDRGATLAAEDILWGKGVPSRMSGMSRTRPSLPRAVRIGGVKLEGHGG